MLMLKDVAQKARFAAMQPAAVHQATATAPINHTPLRHGRCSAVCCICSKQSRPVLADADGEPDLWRMAAGWSMAPLPADYRHRDGSVGSTFTCPGCNARLHQGETLQRRGRNLVEVL